MEKSIVAEKTIDKFLLLDLKILTELNKPVSEITKKDFDEYELKIRRTGYISEVRALKFLKGVITKKTIISGNNRSKKKWRNIY